MARERPVVDDAGEIALLASPTRIEIVDTLESLAGAAATVAELAAAIGRPADGLYYHLRQLAGAGLIEEVVSPEGKRYRSRSHGSKRLRLRYRPGANANADAVGRVASSVLRVAGRDFTRALADPDTVVDGPRRELWIARGKGWVDAGDLAEVNRLLARLMDLVQQPAAARQRGKRKLVALTWVLAPVAAKPARRGTEPS